MLMLWVKAEAVRMYRLIGCGYNSYSSKLFTREESVGSVAS